MVYTCSSLHFAIVLNSSYGNINLKPKQSPAVLGGSLLWKTYCRWTTNRIQKIGHLPCLDKIDSRSRCQTDSPIYPVIVVVPPLNSLMSDQIRRSTEGNVKAAILNVRKANNSDDLELNEMSETKSSWSKEAKYDTIFTHLEAV